MAWSSANVQGVMNAIVDRLQSQLSLADNCVYLSNLSESEPPAAWPCDTIYRVKETGGDMSEGQWDGSGDLWTELIIQVQTWVKIYRDETQHVEQLATASNAGFYDRMNGVISALKTHDLVVSGSTTGIQPIRPVGWLGPNVLANNIGVIIPHFAFTFEWST